VELVAVRAHGPVATGDFMQLGFVEKRFHLIVGGHEEEGIVLAEDDVRRLAQGRDGLEVLFRRRECEFFVARKPVEHLVVVGAQPIMGRQTAAVVNEVEQSFSEGPQRGGIHKGINEEAHVARLEDLLEATQAAHEHVQAHGVHEYDLRHALGIATGVLDRHRTAHVMGDQDHGYTIVGHLMDPANLILEAE